MTLLRRHHRLYFGCWALAALAVVAHVTLMSLHLTATAQAAFSGSHDLSTGGVMCLSSASKTAPTQPGEGGPAEEATASCPLCALASVSPQTAPPQSTSACGFATVLTVARPAATVVHFQRPEVSLLHSRGPPLNVRLAIAPVGRHA